MLIKSKLFKIYKMYVHNIGNYYLLQINKLKTPQNIFFNYEINYCLLTTFDVSKLFI